jgi:hypothetical protein
MDAIKASIDLLYAFMVERFGNNPGYTRVYHSGGTARLGYKTITCEFGHDLKLKKGVYV